ncbi:MAG: cysteine desulfurase family protein [Promethearchaeota archaeon]
MSQTQNKKPVINLDYQASKPVDERVVKRMLPFFDQLYGNPSSLHTIGDVAEDALTKAREQIASFLKILPEEIIFTSGATESVNLALLGYAIRNRRKGNHIIISEVEHISQHNLVKYLEKNGFVVSKVPVDQYGRIRVEKLRKRITDKTILISVQYANNEIGTIQPIDEVGEIAAENGIALHSDAVAAQGQLDLHPKDHHINIMSLSSNDFYGPKGVGALFIQKGFRVSPIIIGGGQEKGIRSGTENVAGIVGMAEATRILQEKQAEEVSRYRQYQHKLQKEILAEVPHSYLNGHPTDRLPNNTHFRFDGIEGESILLMFKEQNMAVSTGSACSSKTLEPSHTLISTGLLHEEAHGSLEFTTGRYTTMEHIDKAVELTPQIVKRLRELSPLYSEIKVT